MRPWIALLVVIAVGGQGCASGRACSDVGGFDGLSLGIPRSLDVESGSVAFDVCDADGCASAAQRLPRSPEGPVGREVNVTFDDLGRSFQPGQVSVTVQVSDSAGEVVASARQGVELARSYPNGKACDGDGYVTGSLELTTSEPR